MWTIFEKQRQKSQPFKCSLCGKDLHWLKDCFIFITPTESGKYTFAAYSRKLKIGMKKLILCEYCFNRYDDLLESLKTEIEHKKIKESIKNEC